MESVYITISQTCQLGCIQTTQTTMRNNKINTYNQTFNLQSNIFVHCYNTIK